MLGSLKKWLGTPFEYFKQSVTDDGYGPTRDNLFRSGRTKEEDMLTFKHRTLSPEVLG